MSSNPSSRTTTTTTKIKPQILIKETIHKTFKTLKSIILRSYQKLPKTSTSTPIKSKLDNFYTSFSERWDSIEVDKKKEGQLSPKGQKKGDEQYSTKSSISVADISGLDDLKEEKTVKYSARKQKQVIFQAQEYALAQKMKELEMMDVNDMDHVLDIEEVLHYYSRLTCPAYQEIVDKFFMDMYSEFHVPLPSRSLNGSMRKLGSASVHSSMRSLGPIKL